MAGKLLASKKTSSPAVGTQLPATPPEVDAQCIGSNQSPEPPTQYNLLFTLGVIVHPVLFPKSELLFALKVAPPVAETSLILKYSPVNVPTFAIKLVLIPPEPLNICIGLAQSPFAIKNLSLKFLPS